jgi:vesicle-fusing ATPase
VSIHTSINRNCVGLSACQRIQLNIDVDSVVSLVEFDTSNLQVITNAIIYLTHNNKSPKKISISCRDIRPLLSEMLIGHVIKDQQYVLIGHQSVTIQIVFAQLDGSNLAMNRGIIDHDTEFTFENDPRTKIVLLDNDLHMSRIFKCNKLNFQAMGIGGLDKQFEEMLRRAFNSRVHMETSQKAGVNHVKGILLFGPPGTGKTAISRQIGKMLNGKEPKIVNGPEILNKFVGQSEENIRNLFSDAEKEYKEKGDASSLHVIIFDEIDAICKKRGSERDGSHHDTIVNQLLTKIDGVESLNNIMVIGMTNRKDMLDDALLRPGRLEVHIEVGLPDEAGRLQILNIHTAKLLKNDFLAENIDLDRIASCTKNYSGAELQGVVNCAWGYALAKTIDYSDLAKTRKDKVNVMVTMKDFEMALHDVVPAFGARLDDNTLKMAAGILQTGTRMTSLIESINRLVQQLVRNQSTMSMISCLLEGQIGTGKSAIAAKTAIDGKFPYVRVLSSEHMVGYSAQAKCNHISTCFNDAYKSQVSVIILDDIERLIEFVDIGPRFSNAVLQTLMVLLKKHPPTNHKLLIIGTTSKHDTMQSLGINELFNTIYNVSCLHDEEVLNVLTLLDIFHTDEINQASRIVMDAHSSITVKKLLFLTEIAKIENIAKVELDVWTDVVSENI